MYDDVLVKSTSGVKGLHNFQILFTSKICHETYNENTWKDKEHDIYDTGVDCIKKVCPK